MRLGQSSPCRGGLFYVPNQESDRPVPAAIGLAKVWRRLFVQQWKVLRYTVSWNLVTDNLPLNLCGLCVTHIGMYRWQEYIDFPRALHTPTVREYQWWTIGTNLEEFLEIVGEVWFSIIMCLIDLIIGDSLQSNGRFAANKYVASILKTILPQLNSWYEG